MSEDKTTPTTPSTALMRTGRTIATFGGDILEFIELNPDAVDEKIFAVMDYQTAFRLKVAPVQMDAVEIVIAVADPSNLAALDDLRMSFAPRETSFAAADPEMIDSVLRRWARYSASLVERAAVEDLRSEPGDEPETKEAADDNGRMAKLVSSILEQAVNLGTSDIHIEPGDNDIAIRFRIDGVLQDHSRYPLSLATGIVSRIKVMANMDIAERRVPLDGRFHRRLAGKEIDFRVVSIPTSTGLEGAVLRLLDQSRTQLSLDDVGFHPEVGSAFLDMLNLPHGMILVTGPTGSGKTTTLYASLGQVARPDRKVFTIEDPVEIRFPAVSQVQVNERAGLTFVSALRSFLRADPDVILVGEIRDSSTAALAAQAALTGHLVLSTLHTNEASGAPTRLSNMGLEGFIVASALKGVLAQRLLRKLCTRCAVPSAASEDIISRLGFVENGIDIPDRLWKANTAGCDHCRNGHRGRVVAAEMLVVTEDIAAAIVDRAPSSEIERLARSSSHSSIHQDGLRWLAEGVVSVDEIERVGL
jgi:type IV pilus assembly protein PilB